MGNVTEPLRFPAHSLAQALGPQEKVHPYHKTRMRAGQQKSHHFYNTADSGSPYLLERRLRRPAAEMNQHLAAREEGRENEPLLAYPRYRSRHLLHWVTCRRKLTGRQAVTQSAAPQPPTFPTRRQRPQRADSQ